MIKNKLKRSLFGFTYLLQSIAESQAGPHIGQEPEDMR